MKQGSGAAPPPRIVVKPDGLDQNLPMLLRPHSVAHSSFAHEIAALRLSFPGHSGRAAGENIQAPRLPSKPGASNDREGTELDHLLAAIASTGRIRSKSKMSAGLRANRSCFQARSAHVGATASELLQTRPSLQTWQTRKESTCLGKEFCLFAFITVLAAKWPRPY